MLVALALLLAGILHDVTLAQSIRVHHHHDSATSTYANPQNHQEMPGLFAFPIEEEASRKLGTLTSFIQKLEHKSESGCVCSDKSTSTSKETPKAKEEEEVHVHDQWYLWSNLIMCLFCVGCVAVISALFLGLLTLDPLDLQIILKVSISEDEKKHAAALLPIVEQHHLVLVTLLLMNGIAYETLPIFMDKLVPEFVAILLSVTLVLFFGEIIPSAYFTGPDQLELATKLAPVMKVSLILFYPVAFPLSKVLDHIVHEGGEAPSSANRYSRDELSALIRIQYEDRMKLKHTRGKGKKLIVPKPSVQVLAPPDSSWRALKREMMEAVDARNADDVEVDETVPDAQEQMNPPLRHDEVNMVEGALQLKTKVAFDVYTPLRKVYALPSNTILNKRTVVSIYANGYSRVPIYEERPTEGDLPDRSGILGILMTRQLIVVDWDHERDVDTLTISKAPCVSPRIDLLSLTNLFQTGGSHIALVCAQPDIANKALDNDLAIPVEAGCMGIVTLEDVLEELLQDDVHDELDVKDRDRAALRLTKWASHRLLVRRKNASMRNRDESLGKSPPKERRSGIGVDIEQGFSNEESPLLNNKNSYFK